MAFTTRNDIVNAPKQRIPWAKTGSRTSIALAPFSVFDVAGSPGAGTLAGTNTANGVVPNDAIAGYPGINAFAGANKGAISRTLIQNTVAGLVVVYDRLFVAGAYAFNANVNLASQPSFAARVPNGTDFRGLEIWIEAVTAFTGNLTITVTYTNQDGTTGRTTGAIATGIAPTIGRCIRLNLQTGDSGVQRIDSVVATVSTVGTFNVMILRPLASYRVKFAGDGEVQDWGKTGMPEVFADSALYMIVTADSTSTGLPYVELDIANS
jgi:hypothetical protein